MTEVKYCLKCAHIVSDNSMFKDHSWCPNCKIPYMDDGITSEQFNSFSDKQKEEYTESLYEEIKKSVVFEKELSRYGKPSFYSSFWFEKYEYLTGDVADRTGDDLYQHMAKSHKHIKKQKHILLLTLLAKSKKILMVSNVFTVNLLM